MLPKRYRFSIIADTAEVVELGRHAILRGWWGDPCRFESGLRHFCLKLFSIAEHEVSRLLPRISSAFALIRKFRYFRSFPSKTTKMGGQKPPVRNPRFSPSNQLQSPHMNHFYPALSLNEIISASAAFHGVSGSILCLLCGKPLCMSTAELRRKRLTDFFQWYTISYTKLPLHGCRWHSFHCTQRAAMAGS